MLGRMGREGMRAGDSDRKAVADQLKLALDEGRLDLSRTDELLDERTKVLALTHQSNVLGTHIAYRDMSVADYTAALTAAGLPPEMAAAVADADAGLARGELFTASDDLVKLIGRPATTAHEAVQNAATIEESR